MYFQEIVKGIIQKSCHEACISNPIQSDPDLSLMVGHIGLYIVSCLPCHNIYYSITDFEQKSSSACGPKHLIHRHIRFTKLSVCLNVFSPKTRTVVSLLINGNEVLFLIHMDYYKSHLQVYLHILKLLQFTEHTISNFTAIIPE